MIGILCWAVELERIDIDTITEAFFFHYLLHSHGKNNIEIIYQTFEF